jgi:transposase
VLPSSYGLATRDRWRIRGGLRACEVIALGLRLNKLKGHRAVATRYDKRDYVFRGTIDVASIRIWLRDPVP